MLNSWAHLPVPTEAGQVSIEAATHNLGWPPEGGRGRSTGGIEQVVPVAQDQSFHSKPPPPPNSPKADLSTRANKQQVGGHEGVGEIVKLGPGAENAGVKVGDRVGIKWLAGICGNCRTYTHTHRVLYTAQTVLV